ncbi:thioredoxin fold domain-containing protein [Caenimonas aquaedulcis]|uniref:Thioredoxin fold domain-containing protein n=1 Tax=Caenimonas aquaedulcis TaxID=2793270 RepID=A0A931H7R8_9BURK|nr:thioredoxin fold domain-containing protein [Caenimonas aquaedulcis]MBG9390254.1 thioredoxin fold domain-containing protein [Caenimonas aquaedulcis]
MNRRHLIAAAVSGSLLLAACGKETPSTPAAAAPDAAKAAPSAVNIAAIEAEAKGFTVGSAMSVRTVYVFFDAQCPHCAVLWKFAKPLKSQAKFVWIPVRILNDASESQGAAILAAKDPVQAMDDHEASMAAKGGGISAMEKLEEQRAQVKKNTQLFNKFGFASIPSIVAMNAKTNTLVTHEGALPTAELAAFLGLQAPAAQ